jgi:hypothetical protein
MRSFSIAAGALLVLMNVSCGQGSYTTVGGIGTTLTLSAPGYTRELPILL